MGDIELVDPLGRVITLHDRTWFGHIIKGHPEVTEYRYWVEKAIVKPEAIRLSRGDRNCRKYIAAGLRATVIMVVIVDVIEGIVKTAYLARRASGSIEWP